MMEDHDKAYDAWRDLGVRGRTLVHVDAHIDFGWVPETDMDEIRSIGEATLLNPFVKSRRRMMTIGNYIYPAMRDGFVDTFYWVVPTPTWGSARGRKAVMGHLKRILSLRRYAGGAIRSDADSIRCRVMGHDLIVCCLETLPRIAGPVLLDIDTDFLVTPRIWDDLAPEREPWIYPAELCGTLAAKVPDADVLTVAYSVEGGFTPLRHKHLGDDVAARFGRDLPENARRAAEEFNASVRELRREGGDLTAAARHYREAVRLDKAYATAYNNYGILYLQKNMPARAAEEFERFLRIDPGNASVLNGLGHIALAKKRYAEAKAYFDRALARDAKHPDARLGSGVALARTGRHTEASALLRALAADRPDDPEAHWWLGWVAEKTGDADAAIRHYQDSVMRGDDAWPAHLRLARLYLMKRMYRRMREEIVRACEMIRI